MTRHLPLLWRFRLARAGHFKVRRETWKMWAAWARAEGGTATNNPWNTTEPWPHATLYNNVGVRNYRSGSDGIAATIRTLENGHYPGLLRDFRAGTKLARHIVSDNAAELGTWGTGASNIMRLL